MGDFSGLNISSAARAFLLTITKGGADDTKIDTMSEFNKIGDWLSGKINDANENNVTQEDKTRIQTYWNNIKTVVLEQINKFQYVDANQKEAYTKDLYGISQNNLETYTSAYNNLENVEALYDYLPEEVINMLGEINKKFKGAIQLYENSKMEKKNDGVSQLEATCINAGKNNNTTEMNSQITQSKNNNESYAIAIEGYFEELRSLKNNLSTISTLLKELVNKYGEDSDIFEYIDINEVIESIDKAIEKIDNKLSNELPQFMEEDSNSESYVTNSMEDNTDVKVDEDNNYDNLQAEDNVNNPQQGQKMMIDGVCRIKMPDGSIRNLDGSIYRQAEQ